MYCSNCGNQTNGTNFCPICGNKLSNVSSNTKKDSGLKIASIILGAVSIFGSLMFIFAPLSFVIALIGLILAIVATKKEKNIPGIILNILGLVISLFFSLIMILLFSFIFSFEGNEYSHPDYENQYYEKFDNILDIY